MYRSGNRGTERLTDPPSVTQVRTLPPEVGLLSATFPVHRETLKNIPRSQWSSSHCDAPQWASFQSVPVRGTPLN